MKVSVLTEVDGDGSPTGVTSYWLWCPACDSAVRISNAWGWNGDSESPTFTPSLLTTATVGGEEQVCHSFVRAGVWEYLNDSTHALAGQQVPMVHLPDWLAM